MASKVTNNAATTLAGSINTVVTTINLAAGTGTLFPILSAGDWFYGTLVDASNNIEIVKVTARATDALTVVRAQDGTTARSYSVGDRFELRPTAALFNDKADLSNPSFGTKITTPAITLGSTALTATGTELNYVAGVTSAIQTQINTKAPTASPAFTGTVDLSAATLKGGTPLVFEGATIDAFKTSVVVTNPTAARTVTIPDANIDLTKVRSGSSSLDGVWRAGTNAEQLAGALSTVLCTPAGLASAMSLNTSGYYKFPGGLIIQWGNVLSSGDIPAGGTTVYGTFPIVFPGWFGCVIPVCDAAYDNNILFSWNIGLTTTSTVAFSAREIVSGVQTNWRVFYIAVGW